MTETSENLPETPQDKETQFILAMFEYNDVRKAGKKAKYKNSVIDCGYLYTKWKNPKFREKIIEVAQTYDLSHLVKMYQLEGIAIESALKQANKKPETAIKNVSKLTRIAKQKRESVGINEPEQAKGQVISVTHIEKVQIAVGDMLRSRLNSVSSSDNQE